MRTQMVAFCMAVAMGLSGWISSEARADILFQDDFELDSAGTNLSATTPPIGDHYGTQGTVRDTTTTPPGSAAGGTKFVQNGGGSDNRWYISTANQTAVTNQLVEFDASFYIVPGSDPTAALDYNTFTNNSFGGRGFDILIHSDGSLQYYDGSNHTVAAVGTIHTGTWITTNVLANFATGTYNATIDGFTFSGAFSGGAGHATNFLTVVPDPDGPVTFFYDNITIALPEPASLGLLALGGVTLLRRRRVCADGRVASRRHTARQIAPL